MMLIECFELMNKRGCFIRIVERMNGIKMLRIE